MNEWVGARSEGADAEAAVARVGGSGLPPVLLLLLLLPAETPGGGETAGRAGTGVAAAEGFGGADWEAILVGRLLAERRGDGLRVGSSDEKTVSPSTEKAAAAWSTRPTWLWFSLCATAFLLYAGEEDEPS